MWYSVNEKEVIEVQDIGKQYLFLTDISYLIRKQNVVKSGNPFGRVLLSVLVENSVQPLSLETLFPIRDDKNIYLILRES